MSYAKIIKYGDNLEIYEYQEAPRPHRRGVRDPNKEKPTEDEKYGKRKMLEKLLSNATFQNKSVVQYIFKNPFQILANTPKNSDLPRMLPDLDSNQDTRLQRAMSYH